MQSPATRAKTWTVVDDSGLPITQIDDFLAYLDNIERSPNTVKAYALDLKSYWSFLEERDRHWDAVTIEDLAHFIRYLRSPDPTVLMLPGSRKIRSEKTVNRALAAVSSFYKFEAQRSDSRTAERLMRHARLARRPISTVLDGVGTISSSHRTTEVMGPRLRTSSEPLETLTVQQARRIIDACTTLRDRLFFTMLFTTGMRRGQALGLRHCDVDTRARTVMIVPRNDNENGARSKGFKQVTLPVSREVTRLYLDYMHTEYGDLDSDYVFVNLWGGVRGAALTDKTVDTIVAKLRVATGLGEWSCHTFRHTWATLHRRAGMSIEVISYLLTHADIKTTASVYTHLDADDLRNELIRYGCWDGS